MTAWGKNDADLRRFQETAGREHLLRHVAASGRLDAFARVLDVLEPVLAALASGEQPRYAEVDRTALERDPSETLQVVHWLISSPKADLRSAGLTLAGTLGVHEPLAEAARSPHQWERLTAIDALTRISGDRARELLDELRAHEDPVTAQAARDAH